MSETLFGPGLGAHNTVHGLLRRGDTQIILQPAQGARGSQFEIGQNTTGDTLTSQVRATADAVAALATLSVDAVDESTGIYSVSILQATSEGLSGGRYVWDVEWDDGSDVRTVLAGYFDVVPDVSR